MKKGVVLFGILLLVFTLGINSAVGAIENETQNVNKAYDCLRDTIDTKKCSELSLSEQIFSLLSVGKCKNEVIEKSDENECWPEGKCDIKTTAQAVLALNNNGVNTNKAEAWLLENRIVPTDLTWYLEIESESETTCTVSYLGESYNINIAENKQIDNAAGSCLTLGPGNYWLEIDSACYDEEFEISCDERFITTLLFTKFDSSTYHILDVTHSAPEEGKTIEQIQSYCFSKGSTCDYESNAWASTVLDILDHDVSAFVPYLITSQEREYFPEPFLYMLTGYNEYKSSILDLQINKQYWKVSKDKYQDTALALLPFQNQELEQKDFTKKWLFETQQTNGCWDGGNVRSNAFILYSLWPKYNFNYIEDDDDGEEVIPDNGCKESGYFCMIASNCQGDPLPDYTCAGTSKCCSTEYMEQTCAEQSGEICATNEYCVGGDEIYAGYLSYGEVCCISSCEVREEPVESSCAQNFGICESFGCGEGYTESTEYTCDYSGETCCMEEEDLESGGFWWVWVLFILIVLIVIAIIYRDKFREFFLKMQGKKITDNRRPGIPPSYERMPQRIPIQRRIIPQQQPMPRVQNPRPRPPRELDDVLKKLKDMSR